MSGVIALSLAVSPAAAHTKGEVRPRIPLNGGEEKGDAIREERLPLLSGCLPGPEFT